MTPERKEILLQITKLRAHAVSSRALNEVPEAEAFEEKVKSLMTDNKVTEKELDDFKAEEDSTAVTEASAAKVNCYRVLYSTIKISGEGANAIRHGTDRNKFVVAKSDLEAGDAVLKIHPDFDEVQIQQVATVAKDVLVV